MKRNHPSDIDFVTRHYRSDAFKPIMRFAPTVWWRRRPAIAAAVAAGVLAASAGIYMLMPHADTQDAPPEPKVVSTVQPTATHDENQIARLEFTDTPLPEVVKSIEETYGVTIEGYEDHRDLQVTLSYEGTATDLIETINLTLGTELSIKQ